MLASDTIKKIEMWKSYIVPNSLRTRSVQQRATWTQPISGYNFIYFGLKYIDGP